LRAAEAAVVTSYINSATPIRQLMEKLKETES
jgi:hypothetical protein